MSTVCYGSVDVLRDLETLQVEFCVVCVPSTRAGPGPAPGGCGTGTGSLSSWSQQLLELDGSSSQNTMAFKLGTKD